VYQCKPTRNRGVHDSRDPGIKSSRRLFTMATKKKAKKAAKKKKH